MPNLLVHFGVQGFATRAAVKDADARWILLGCLLPDLPWIGARLVRGFNLPVDPYDLRLYAIVQASLLLCLVLCGAIAALSASPRRIFAILAFNSTLHLLLDACQTKWGNGVHLFAPFSWEMVNFGLFWPENPVVPLLAVLGIVFIVLAWRTHSEPRPTLFARAPRRYLAASILVVIYLLLPLALKQFPEATDSHFVQTLRQYDLRAGRNVELDRADNLIDGTSHRLETFGDEELLTTGDIRSRARTVSVRATFIDLDTVVVHELHEHPHGIRDTASYIGLVLFAVIWIRLSLRRGVRPQLS